MVSCVHCDEKAFVPLYLEEDKAHQLPFCCQGCLTVYEILKLKGLSSYYDIKNSSTPFKRRSPVEISTHDLKYLDDEKFLADHAHHSPDGDLVMEFYLEGIHCLACLWLIEKLPEFVPGISSSKLDLDKSVVRVAVREGKFSEVARELDRLGYRPHALKRDESSDQFRRAEERTYLKRLGVAGAAAGNIMIYSVSLYGGATEEMARIFNILTVILAIPVFTYSAWPFYKSAWTAIKNKTISIDVPISMALLMGATMGVWGLVQRFEENYFDSLTALVFLLLLSRYFLRKIQDKGLSANDLHYFYQNESILRKTADGFEEIHHQYLQVGDIIKVRREEFIPADGIVLEGDSLINNSLLTGESMPDHVKIGHKVFSGTQNLGEELLMRVERANKDSRLGKILKNVEQGWALRSRTVDVTAVVARYFTLSVVLLSVLLFLIILPEGSSIALERAFTLLIVTCPCALAISVPLTFHRSLSLAAQHGIIVKSDEVFEKLSQLKSIYLDKTGTITAGRLEVTELITDRDLSNIIYSLEKNSRHPVARALTEYVLRKNVIAIEVENFREIPGNGVEGYIGGKFIEIGKGEIKENGHVIGHFTVKDVIRPDSRRIISRLMKNGHDVHILSGDKSEVVKAMAIEAGIPSAQALPSISPEEKVSQVKNSKVIMVGDGANDAMALSAAEVGIAVSGAMDIALRASDVYLTTPGLDGVEKLLTLSRETMKVVRRNLVLSLIYNSLSVIFVFTGVIGPLVAAIVMPVSSLTVLLSTLAGTKKMRSLWKS
ncbi:MAG: heavy metal translocating P-type ATPase [Bacteriovoracaceae bacterium]